MILDLYKEAYMMTNGEMIYTYTGEGYFSIDQYGKGKQYDKVDFSRVSYKIK